MSASPNAVSVECRTDVDGASVFLSPRWFELLSATGPRAEAPVRVYSLRTASGESIAELPTVEEAGRGLWRPRTLRALSSYYTPLFAPLVTPGAALTCLPEVARVVARERAWDIVDLQPLAIEAPTFVALEDAFRAAGYLTQRYFRFANWYLHVAGRSFEQYCESLPAALRNTIRRKTRKLAASHDVRVAITTGEAADLERIVGAYERVYAASWKEPEPDPTFIPRLIRVAAAEGWLRLGVLYIDDQPAAAQLWLTSGGTASIYKLAHDERYAEWSVGSQLMLEMMRHALDVDRVDEVDFLMGDEPYKRDWMSGRRERWGIMAFDPRRPLGLLAAMRHIGGRALRKMFAR
ncbi:MAG TPA: GNAT family N-acetyltransferase [Burkholderiales bacterium]|nr:GNAT family N-acetyltransferase [Burkholderiales bacterium]